MIPMNRSVPKRRASAIADALAAVGSDHCLFGDTVASRNPIDVGEIISKLILERQRVSQAISLLERSGGRLKTGKRQQDRPRP